MYFYYYISIFQLMNSSDFESECLILIFLARLLILIKKVGLLQLKFGVVGIGIGVNIYLWARSLQKFSMYHSQICYTCYK